jgi:uncharacterized protein (DUF3084 family)
MLNQAQRGMSAVLKISTSHFLFIIEIIVISVGIALFIFFQNRKLKSGHNNAKEPVQKIQVEKKQPELQEQAKEQGKVKAEISKWKEKFDNIQQKFDRIKEVNVKLKALIGSIVPESSESENMQQLLSDMDLSNKDLDACIGEVKEKMKGMGEQISSYNKEIQSHKKEAESQKEEITQLNRKLKNTVNKAEYDSIEADKNRLELKVEQLEKQLKEKTEEFQKMEKEHMWLEKEYNMMYNNMEEDENGNLKPAAAG